MDNYIWIKVLKKEGGHLFYGTHLFTGGLYKSEDQFQIKTYDQILEGHEFAAPTHEGLFENLLHLLPGFEESHALAWEPVLGFRPA